MTEAATIATITRGIQGPRQFQGVFDLIPFKFNLDEDSIASAAASAGNVAVPGAALGDFVLVTPEVDAVDTQVSASVTAADVVTVVINNLTGAASTAFAANPSFTGLVLKVKANTYDDLS